MPVKALLTRTFLCIPHSYNLIASLGYDCFTARTCRNRIDRSVVSPRHQTGLFLVKVPEVQSAIVCPCGHALAVTTNTHTTREIAQSRVLCKAIEWNVPRDD